MLRFFRRFPVAVAGSTLSPTSSSPTDFSRFIADLESTKSALVSQYNALFQEGGIIRRKFSAHQYGAVLDLNFLSLDDPETLFGQGELDMLQKILSLNGVPIDFYDKIH